MRSRWCVNTSVRGAGAEWSFAGQIAQSAFRRTANQLLSASVVAIAPVAATGALPAIVLIGARCSVSCANCNGHGNKDAITPIASAAIVVDVSAIDVPRHVAIYRAIDVPIDVAAAVHIGLHVSCLAARMMAAAATGVCRCNRERHAEAKRGAACQ
jgi:hypothetical protein